MDPKDTFLSWPLDHTYPENPDKHAATLLQDFDVVMLRMQRHRARSFN